MSESRAPSPDASVSAERPWLGLRSFTESARAFFFGRTAEVDDLYERIVDKPLTVLFGQSGLGKSSLLQAALAPRLRESGFLPVLIRLDHDAAAPTLDAQLIEQLAAALDRAGSTDVARRVRESLQEATTHADRQALLFMLFHDPRHGLIPSRSEPGSGVSRPVFLIDQFEEVFTLGGRSARVRESAAFRETLGALIENRPPPSLTAMVDADEALALRIDHRLHYSRVLLSLREDFLHLLERWRRTIPSVMENRMELRMLNGVQALAAVVEPGRFRTGLPEIIPEDVGRRIVRFVADVGAEVPLEEIDAVPPLLSLVCAELNARRIDAGEAQISASQFEGSSADILASFYERSFDVATYGTALEQVDRGEEGLRRLRILIEDRLISADGFRESVAMDTLLRDLAPTTGSESARVILDVIVDRRLLTVDERGGVRRVELAHDVLTKIVRSSRDERQELEAVTRARSEKAQAEAETARIRRQRNRLRALAAVACVLALVALVGGALGWIGMKQSKEAATKAVKANEQLGTMFKDGVDGLERLFEEHTRSTENQIGLESAQVRAMQAGLRDHVVVQLRARRKEYPEQADSALLVAKLLVAGARDAIADADVDRAKAMITEARTIVDEHPPETVDHAETLADVLLEEARIPAREESRTGEAALWIAHLEIVRDLAVRWPESWRLAYVSIRLENGTLFDIGRRDQFHELAARLRALVEPSGRSFEPIFWSFVIARNASQGEGNFNRSADHYESFVPMIVWYRDMLFPEPPSVNRTIGDLGKVEDGVTDAGPWTPKLEEGQSPPLPSTTQTAEPSARTFSAYQRVVAAEGVLEFVNALVPFYESRNDARTVDARRMLLRELELTADRIDWHLPKSKIAIRVRHALLGLQEAAQRDGAGTLDGDRLVAARERNQLIASALGLGSSVADSVGASFADFFAADATELTRARSLATLRGTLTDFKALSLSEQQTVLRRAEVIAALDKLKGPPRPPIAEIHEEMLEAHMRLFQLSSRSARAGQLLDFADVTSRVVERWLADGADERIISLWSTAYRDLAIRQFSKGDGSALVTQLKCCIVALLRAGRIAEAKELLSDTVQLCDGILAERPWDWYVNEAYTSLRFTVAGQLVRMGDRTAAQPLLRGAWTRSTSMNGEEIDLDRFAELPLRGETPEGASEREAAFFALFAPEAPPAKSRIKRFTVPTDFNGKKLPFHVYILDGKNGYKELLDQFRWIKEIRGGIVPSEVQDSFMRLNNIAVENNVSFMELCVYALGTASKEEETKQKADPADPSLDREKGEAPTPDDGKGADGAAPDTQESLSRAAFDDNLDGIEPIDPDQFVVLLLNGKNPSGERIYSYLKVTLQDLQRLKSAVNAGKGFTPSDFGEIVAEGLGDPTEEVKARIAKDYPTPTGVATREGSTKKAAEESGAGKAKRAMDEALSALAAREQEFTKSDTKTAREALARALNRASDRGLYLRRWTDVEAWSRRCIGLETGQTPYARGNLATALLFQSRYDDAMSIYRAHWNDVVGSRTFGEMTLADFDALEQTGITHADTARVKAELGAPRASEPAKTDAPASAKPAGGAGVK